jgi:hypothetical protein
VNQMIEADQTDRRARGTLSALSGLAVLCILAAVLFASTFIGSGKPGETPHLDSYPPGAFHGNPEPDRGIILYLLDSDAQREEIRHGVVPAAAEVAQIPLPSYPNVVTLLARTADEEALAYARILEEVRSRKGEPLSIEVIDLRAQKPSHREEVIYIVYIVDSQEAALDLQREFIPGSAQPGVQEQIVVAGTTEGRLALEAMTSNQQLSVEAGWPVVVHFVNLGQR